MNFSKKIHQPQIGLPMAAMLDLMFQILIIFMAASVMAEMEKNVNIKVPKATTGTTNASGRSDEIIINLDKTGKIEINSVSYGDASEAAGGDSLGRLRKLLADISEANAEQRIIVRADKDSTHAMVMKVLDACKLAKIGNISFATLPTGAEAPAKPATGTGGGQP